METLKLISRPRQTYNMQLEDFAKHIADQAKQIQSELERLKNESPSNQSTDSTLSRIEERLIKVHDNTDTLVDRVPENLRPLLNEIKSSILQRIDSLKPLPTGSNESVESAKPKDDKDQLKSTFDKLTGQEKRLFQICFQAGLISYKELAHHLNITPVSAKNIVNRLFKDDKKQKLFIKQKTCGITKIALNKRIEKQILSGKNETVRKNGRTGKLYSKPRGRL